MNAATNIDFANHPCFNREAHLRFGRIHLPIAPRCNMQCNFCNRKYDCINESRPGVTSVVLTPSQALAYLTDAISRRPEIQVVGLAGPGDPFANPIETMLTIHLVRERFPHLMLCIATNGLGIGPHIDDLARLQVSHVSITITAVDPKIGALIYAWIRDGKRPLRGEAAASLLLERQMDAVRRLKQHGIIVKINSIIIPGINDKHFPKIARTASEMGVDLMNCMPLVPVAGSGFEDLPEPDHLQAARVRGKCKLYLPQMTHCTRCRADSVGLITETFNAERLETIYEFARIGQDQSATKDRQHVAVASMEGALVNQHLGEARQVLIYGRHRQEPEAFQLKEIRKTPESGSGERRWKELAALLNDCRAFLVSSSGRMPKEALAEAGIEVIEMEGLIEDGLRAVYANQPIPAVMRRSFNGCSKGADCKGTGTGCG
jgi:nitrogen fixation protein NifB